MYNFKLLKYAETKQLERIIEVEFKIESFEIFKFENSSIDLFSKYFKTFEYKI